MKLNSEKVIEFKNIFIDGTKIEANANRYTFVWKKAVDKFEEKLQESIMKTLRDIIEINNTNIEILTDKVTVGYAEDILSKL